jgi:predicted Zn-dependent protease
MISEFSSLLRSLDLKADWVGLRVVRDASTVRTVRDSSPTRNHTTLSQGVMAEVLVDGQMGYGATNALHPEAVRLAIQSAQEQAIAAKRWGIHTTSSKIRPTMIGQYTSPIVKPLEMLSAADINDILVRLCQQLAVSAQIVQAVATAITKDIDTWFISSTGSEVHQKLWLVEGHFGATAQDGNVIQPRTNHGYLAHSYQGGWEHFLTDDLWERSQQIGEEAIELLTSEECPTETTTLILSPDQMMLQIHESVGHPLELDRILGDERNYAGGSFVKPSDFGQLVYGSPIMNITFDPTVSNELASYQFDDTGAPAERQYLIRNGKLERGLGSLESQERLNLPGVACARASSWNRPPIDRMANINLEPGNATFEDMLSGIERGVYMETNRSWSIDDQRYKFQFGCEYAKQIENGKLTKTLRNPNYRATTPRFWHRLKQVGDRSTWRYYGTPFCGKGEPNQLMRVGHGSPICAFEDIEVFGGGA